MGQVWMLSLGNGGSIGGKQRSGVVSLVSIQRTKKQLPTWPSTQARLRAAKFVGAVLGGESGLRSLPTAARPESHGLLPVELEDEKAALGHAIEREGSGAIPGA